MDENLSDVIVRLLFAAVLLYHVFNVAESILEFVVITQKSVAFTVSGNHVLKFFCDHVMVLFVAANVDAGDCAEHSWQANERDINEEV